MTTVMKVMARKRNPKPKEKVLYASAWRRPSRLRTRALTDAPTLGSSLSRDFKYTVFFPGRDRPSTAPPPEIARSKVSRQQPLLGRPGLWLEGTKKELSARQALPV